VRGRQGWNGTFFWKIAGDPGIFALLPSIGEAEYSSPVTTRERKVRFASEANAEGSYLEISHGWWEVMRGAGDPLLLLT